MKRAFLENIARSNNPSASLRTRGGAGWQAGVPTVKENTGAESTR